VRASTASGRAPRRAAATAPRAGREHDGARQEAGALGGAHRRLARQLEVAHGRAVPGVERPRRLVGGAPRGEPGEGVDPVAARLVGRVARAEPRPEGERDEHVHAPVHGGARKAARGHPGQGDVAPVDRERAPDGGRVGAEVRGPVRVAHDGDRRGTGAVVARAEQPAARGRNA
jgi:hypothetical protein